MTIADAFPVQFYLNLNKHDERRRQTLLQLLDAGLQNVERVAAVDGRWVTSIEACRGYSSEKRYAQALTHKMAIWRARQRQAPAVLLFEDDVVLAKDVNERLAEINLPDDWGIFYSAVSTLCDRWSWPQVWSAARRRGICTPMR